MSIQLQEIQSIYISQNRLVEGKDYKRAEWLKKSGWARIDIPTNYNMVDSVTTYFKHYGGTMGQMPIFGGDKIHALLWKYNSSINMLDTYFNSQYYFDTNVTEGKFKVSFNWQTKKRLIRWNDVSKGGWRDCTLDKTNTKISVLDSGRFNQSWHTHTGALAMKYFFLAPNIYLYPCQLLRSIPATLDANGIARSAGECGMVDSISGKFYGNVASSGAFTVENLDESGTVEDTRLHQIYRNKLVEGEDYIVGEWLKGDGNAYIDTKVTDLSTSDYIKTVFDDTYNIRANKPRTWGREGNRLIVGNDNTSTEMTVWGSTSAFNYYNNGAYLYDMYFDLLNNKVIVNNNTSTLALSHGDGLSFVLFARHANSSTVDIINFAKFKSFEIHNQINLVPCKLLRPIPRNLDAQCKSRIAGECGMIDLVSGRFYGNVAESGAFSLAWDEWLKDCSIQFDANYLGWTMQYPPTISYQGRIKVANLPDELTDFGFLKLSKTQVVMGENVWSFNNWGSGTWATFNASYGGGYGCGCSINGSSVGSQQEQVATELSCSINLQDIMQINKIEFIAYIDQQTTHTVKFTRGFDETLNKQYLISDYDNTRIYAD